MPIAAAMPYIATAAAAGGTIIAADGARKSVNAQKDAIAANKTSTDETNRLNYARWLESQGVDANGQAINTWLPRYASINRKPTTDGSAPIPQFVATPQASANFAPTSRRSWAGLGVNSF